MEVETTKLQGIVTQRAGSADEELINFVKRRIGFFETTKTDCRVAIPAEADQWMRRENARRKQGTTERVIPITDVMKAILAVGLRAGGWQEVAIEIAAQKKPLTRRGRQFTAQKK